MVLLLPLLLLALGAIPVVVVWYRRNAARAAAGFPAWSRYRVPDPNAVQSSGSSWIDRDTSPWDSSIDGAGGGDAHGACDGGSAGGDAGGGHGD